MQMEVQAAVGPSLPGWTPKSSGTCTTCYVCATSVALVCLTYLSTNNAARTLNKLKMLDVSGCNNMKEIVATEEGEERNLQAVKFSHLRTLKLWSLKSLIRFSLGRCSYDFPSLRNISILECTQLKAFIHRPPAPSVEMMNEGATSFDEGPYSLFDEKVLLFPFSQWHRCSCDLVSSL